MELFERKLPSKEALSVITEHFPVDEVDILESTEIRKQFEKSKEIKNKFNQLKAQTEDIVKDKEVPKLMKENNNTIMAGLKKFNIADVEKAANLVIGDKKVAGLKNKTESVLAQSGADIEEKEKLVEVKSVNGADKDKDQEALETDKIQPEEVAEIKTEEDKNLANNAEEKPVTSTTEVEASGQDSEMKIPENADIKTTECKDEKELSISIGTAPSENQAEPMVDVKEVSPAIDLDAKEESPAKDVDAKEESSAKDVDAKEESPAKEVDVKEDSPAKDDDAQEEFLAKDVLQATKVSGADTKQNEVGES